MKKGELMFDQLGKFLIAVVVLVILVIIAFVFKSKMVELLESIKEIF